MSGAMLIVLAIAFGWLTSRTLPALRTWWRVRRGPAWLGVAAAAEPDDNDGDPDPPAELAQPDPLRIEQPPPEYPAELLRQRAPEPPPGTVEAGLARWVWALRVIHRDELATARQWLDIDDAFIDSTGNLVVQLYGSSSSARLYPKPGAPLGRNDLADPSAVHRKVVELVHQVRAIHAARPVDDRLQHVLQRLDADDIDLVVRCAERLGVRALKVPA